MPEMPKRIDFADIQVGDKIRVVDVHDVVVTQKNVSEFRYAGGAYIYESLRDGAVRKFQLVERPIPHVPQLIGCKIRVNGRGGGVWVLIWEDWRHASVWVSIHNGSRLDQHSMFKHVAERGGFEVVE